MLNNNSIILQYYSVEKKLINVNTCETNKQQLKSCIPHWLQQAFTHYINIAQNVLSYGPIHIFWVIESLNALKNYCFIFTICKMWNSNYIMVFLQHCVVYLLKFHMPDTMRLTTWKSSTWTKWFNTTASKATIPTDMLLRNACFLTALRSGTD